MVQSNYCQVSAKALDYHQYVSLHLNPLVIVSLIQLNASLIARLQLLLINKLLSPFQGVATAAKKSSFLITQYPSYCLPHQLLA